MHIALISTPFVSVPPRAYGGTELIVFELAEGLLDRGHEVTIFATGDSESRAEVRALYRSPCWPPNPLSDLNHVSWALREVAKGRYDVAHAHSAVALVATRLLPKLPLVYTLHHARDAQLSSYYRHFPTAQFVAISADQRDREVPLARCEVIHHGLDANRYEWTETPDDYVCFVGRFAQVKGPHTAIDVAGWAGVPIRVAGEVHVPDRDFARSELAERLSRPYVRYLGCVGTAEKVPLLRQARALLVPIEWNEPFGLILIEAALSGCPVVAFRRGSVPELIEQDVTGYIVDSVDDMVEIIRPGGPVERFDRARCRARAVYRFSRTQMVAAHERLYARVIAGATEGPRRSSVALG